jgi:WD40 repeat protein
VIPESPYKGLVPFEDSELDALLFFGRERESGIISENVLAARLTVLYGPSGVGKTSVLRAGVAHGLRRQARQNVEERGHPEFTVVVFDAWSEDPVSSLRAAVREELAAQFGSALLDEPEGESLADTFGRWTEGLACDLLLILDQAEEYFLYHQGQGGFAAELPELVTLPGLRVRVLLSLRDDALAKLDRFKGRIPNLFANYLRLDHLDRRSAAEAIVKPVERYNGLTGESIEVEPQLVEAVLDETAAGQVDLGSVGRVVAVEEEAAGRIEAAYLQLVLERLWEDERAAGSSRLRVTTLASLGGAESIVRAHLRRAVEGLSSEERDVAADVFRFLVTPSGTKIAHGASDLAEYAAVDEQRMLPVLSTLGRERILRTVDGAGADGARYEIFHDVLGEPVLAWRREQELERERRAAERRHRRLAVITVVALIGLAAMTAVAIYALSQRSEARENARAARASERSARSRELGALAQSDLATDPLRSVALALQAVKLDPTPAAEDTLRTALVDSRLRRILRAGRGPVNAAAYSPDGSMVVTASEDGTARVFRVRDGSLLAELHHRGSVTDAGFSADGRFIATSSRDKTARLWTRSGRLVRTFPHGGAVVDVALSPDSEKLVTLADDATLHVWSLSDPARSPTVFAGVPGDRLVLSRDGSRAAVVDGDRYARVYSLASEQPLTQLPHVGRVRAAAFGPSSNVLATGSADKLARVWNLVTFTLADTLRGHQGQVVDVAIGRRGQFVATASLDGTAAIWNIAASPARLVATLSGHSNYVNDVEFSPDGLYVVTSSRDGTARVWKTKGGALQAVLAGHEGSVTAASFSPTGSNVLTYSGDGTARIWDSGTNPELRPVGLHPRVSSTLDLTRTLALTAGADGTARIWNLRTGRSTILGHLGPVRDAAFSPSGHLVVTASTDHAARVWTTSGARRQTLRHPAAVTTAGFSPDSKLVATGAADGRVRIWKVDSGQQIATLRAGSPVDRLAFDPKRDLLATAGGNVVRLWSTRNWKPERILRGQHGAVTSLSFSHEGNSLLTGSRDATGRIWSLDSGRMLALSGHRDGLTSARFSPDDRLVATASLDHDVRVWNARTGKLVPPVLRAHFGAVRDARFSDDGRWIVSAGPGSAGLWEVRTHRLIALLRGRPSGARGPTGRGSIGTLYAAGFSPGTFRVVTVGQDGAVRTYLCRVCADVDGLERLASAELAEVGAHN